MFKVIRIPTKFSRTIKRLTEKEKAELLGLLMDIGSGLVVQLPDTLVWDTVWLIYWEWMNMESKNGNKPEKSLVQYSSESPGEPCAGNPDTRVEYSRVEESIVDKDISKDISTTEVAVVDDKSSRIDNMQKLIKETFLENNLMYTPWSQERNRIHNILTAKAFWENCELVNMTREQFVVNIIKLSITLKYSKKINNAVDLYSNYAAVYNLAVTKKAELLIPKKKRSIW